MPCWWMVPLSSTLSTEPHTQRTGRHERQHFTAERKVTVKQQGPLRMGQSGCIQFSTVTKSSCDMQCHICKLVQ
jgi:hypothetical protein